jgi:hypothetical protein
MTSLCTAAVNMRGEHIPCELKAPHNGLAHENSEHQMIWQGHTYDQTWDTLQLVLDRLTYSQEMYQKPRLERNDGANWALLHVYLQAYLRAASRCRQRSLSRTRDDQRPRASYLTTTGVNYGKEEVSQAPQERNAEGVRIEISVAALFRQSTAPKVREKGSAQARSGWWRSENSLSPASTARF